MGNPWEYRRLIPESTWTYGATVRTLLPSSGMLSSLILDLAATPVSNARMAIEKWRLIDYINNIKVLVNGSTVEKSFSGRLAHYLQWSDGGPVNINQVHNYATATDRLILCINFGQYLKDLNFGLDLSKYDSVELQISNDATVGIYTAFATPIVFGVFLRDAPPGTFAGHIRTEVLRQWTTVQDATEYIKLQEEGRLRKIVFQADPLCTTNANADDLIYNVLNNIRITHRAKQLELFNGPMRDLMYLNSFEDGRDVIVGIRPYNTTEYGVRTGVGYVISEAMDTEYYGTTQNTYAPGVVASDDGPTLRRVAGENIDQTGMLVMGLAMENCVQWRHDTYGDISLAPDMQVEKPIEVECKTANSATSAGGTIRLVTDRLMAR